MTRKSFFLLIVLTVLSPVIAFAQTGAAAVRDYVGLINQSYHPGIVSFLEDARERLRRQGEADVVRGIDILLSGAFGSGFVYSDRGNFYVITNNHVISQAHTVSITFERPDGTRTRFDNLRIIATDEETDLALLAFPPGQSPPVAQGLSLLARPIQEGETVFSAGFPGLGATPLWQFGSGMVSNSAARFPRSLADETIIGPFIQHNAPVDPGNSGGPLLVAQNNAPSGFAVAGVNTLTAIGRQAANFSVPASAVLPFVQDALNPRPETFRAALDERLSDFVRGLGVPRAVYPHIAAFLSVAAVGENIEFAYDELFDRAPRVVVRSFIERGREDFIAAMGLAVAWTIEDSVRIGTGALRASITEVTGSGEEYTVVFTINNRDVSSVWVREYGNWRIRTFGTIAAGDRELIARRQLERERDQNVRIRGHHFEVSYAHLFDKAPAAFYASLSIDLTGMFFFRTVNFAAGMNFIGVDSDFWGLGAFYDMTIAFRAGNIGFMPYGRLGLMYFHDREFRDYTDDISLFDGTGMGYMGIAFSLFGQVGLRVTTGYVPGLSMGVGFLHSLLDTYIDRFNNPMRSALFITIGYTF